MHPRQRTLQLARRHTPCLPSRSCCPLPFFFLTTLPHLSDSDLQHDCTIPYFNYPQHFTLAHDDFLGHEARRRNLPLSAPSFHPPFVVVVIP